MPALTITHGNFIPPPNGIQNSPALVGVQQSVFLPLTGIPIVFTKRCIEATITAIGAITGSMIAVGGISAIIDPVGAISAALNPTGDVDSDLVAVGGVAAYLEDC